MNLILEIISVGLSLIFLILLIKENINCWFFGILGSLVSISLFYNIGLYAESILYIYYVIIGFYGYYIWKNGRNNNNRFTIEKIPLRKHILLILVGIFTALGLAYLLSTYTDASSPYLDAFTTIFSFIASYLEAKKILRSWHYWILINGVTLALYFNKGLFIYFGLTLIYFAISFYGLRTWKRKFVNTNSI